MDPFSVIVYVYVAAILFITVVLISVLIRGKL